MKKGLAASIWEVFNTFVVIGMIIFVVFIWKGSYFDLNYIVTSGEDQRRIITIGQILLSLPDLAVIDNERVMRSTMDPVKLDSLMTDSQDLYQKIRYPGTSYKFKIMDYKSGKTWLITPGTIEADVEYIKKFPLTIKYSDDKINVGVMELKFYTNHTS